MRVYWSTVVLGNHHLLDNPGTAALCHSVLTHVVCSRSSLHMALVCVFSIGFFGGGGDRGFRAKPMNNFHALDSSFLDEIE